MAKGRLSIGADARRRAAPRQQDHRDRPGGRGGPGARCSPWSSPSPSAPRAWPSTPRPCTPPTRPCAPPPWPGPRPGWPPTSSCCSRRSSFDAVASVEVAMRDTRFALDDLAAAVADLEAHNAETSAGIDSAAATFTAARAGDPPPGRGRGRRRSARRPGRVLRLRLPPAHRRRGGGARLPGLPGGRRRRHHGPGGRHRPLPGGLRRAAVGDRRLPGTDPPPAPPEGTGGAPGDRAGTRARRATSSWPTPLTNCAPR